MNHSELLERHIGVAGVRTRYAGPENLPMNVVHLDDCGRLLHIMLEVRSLADVGRAYDRCLDGAAPIVLSLGRHTNDEMTSFYLQTPSGFEIEYGWGGRELPEGAVTAGHYSAPSRWGHRPLRDTGPAP